MWRPDVAAGTQKYVGRTATVRSKVRWPAQNAWRRLVAVNAPSVAESRGCVGLQEGNVCRHSLVVCRVKPARSLVVVRELTATSIKDAFQVRRDVPTLSAAKLRACVHPIRVTENDVRRRTEAVQIPVGVKRKGAVPLFRVSVLHSRRVSPKLLRHVS